MNLGKKGSDLGMSLGKRSDLGMRGLGKKSSDLGMKMGDRWDLYEELGQEETDRIWV
jgi:IS1 family transposase